MQRNLVQIDPRDNVLVALADLHRGETVTFADQTYAMATDVPAKHKFATQAFAVGDPIVMYGVMVGKAAAPIARGETITTRNQMSRNRSHRHFRVFVVRMAGWGPVITGSYFRWSFARTAI